MKLPALSILAIIVLLSVTTLVHAQTVVLSPSPTSTTVQSDFAKDLQDGEQSTANDQQAQQNQKDAKDSEQVGVNEQGQFENGQRGIDQQDLTESQDNLNQEGNNDQGTGTIKHENTTNGTTQQGTQGSQQGNNNY